MDLTALYPRRRTSQPGKGHKIYPYLLRHLSIERAKPAASSLYSTPTAPVPWKMPSQFTSEALTDLKDKGVAISMDGNRWVDNVFVERLWRSVKYEDLYRASLQLLDVERRRRNLPPALPIVLPDDPRVRELNVRTQSLDDYQQLIGDDDNDDDIN